MAVVISANSYGDETMVAERVRRYTRNNLFTTDTTPTLDAVRRFINQISGMLNVIMAAQGFTIPIVQADALELCEGVVVDHVADLCHASNSAGRFYTSKALRTKSPTSVIKAELTDWVEEIAPGFEELGVPRQSAFANIGARTMDDTGTDIENIFKRDDFGNKFD